MAGTREDKLEAAKLRSALSTSLITATGTAVAAGLALVAFATGLHDVGGSAAFWWVGGATVLFVSALTGGLGIKKLSQLGSEGEWTRSRSAWYFGVQAAAFTVGVILFAIGTVAAFGTERRTTPDDRQDRAIERLSTELEAAREQNEALDRRLRAVERRR
ncbi:MAG TPA: hypothetical protein VF529_13815 [Solirubrobacteraceae bacterium]